MSSPNGSVTMFVLRALVAITVMAIGSVTAVLWNFNSQIASLSTQVAEITKRFDRLERTIITWEGKRYKEDR